MFPAEAGTTNKQRTQLTTELETWQPGLDSQPSPSQETLILGRTGDIFMRLSQGNAPPQHLVECFSNHKCGIDLLAVTG